MMKVIDVKKHPLKQEKEGHEQYKMMWGNFLELSERRLFLCFSYLNDYIPQEVGYLMVHFWNID